ncbi:MAG: hypothetical protein AB3N06_09250 [Erythrobacter sp.]
MIAALLLSLGTISGPPAPEAESFPEPRSPMIGLDGPSLDACGGLGRVGGTYREQVIRDAPDEAARTSDTLEQSTLVWLCEAEGDWQGVVYASGEFQEVGDCRVSSPVAEPRAYDGPCRAGWVPAKDVEFLAG